jgi:hypothetical protein
VESSRAARRIPITAPVVNINISKQDDNGRNFIRSDMLFLFRPYGKSFFSAQSCRLAPFLCGVNQNAGQRQVKAQRDPSEQQRDSGSPARQTPEVLAGTAANR